MAGIFISYRRSASKHLAQLIFRELRQRGHDVFLDVTTIDSGAFDRIILNQIAARPHFLLILSPGSLERCANDGDWLSREIEEAFRLERNIIPIFVDDFKIENEKQYLPDSLRSELPRQNGIPYHDFFADPFFDILENRFLKTPVYEVKITETPVVERVEVQRRIEQAEDLVQKSNSSHSKVYDILPAPFEWIEIPAGKLKVKSGKGRNIPEGMIHTSHVANFYMSKYPVTNAQFAKFVEDGGYSERKWWSYSGWNIRKEENWNFPLYWQDKQLNKIDCPVIGISFYEANAFCNWLRTISSEEIFIPTEGQWQRAAQGDDERLYPWGNNWDDSRCNNSVQTLKNKYLTSITEYEGYSKGDSSFGVVDLSGNVWEWCCEDSFTKSYAPDYHPDFAILRGGSRSSSDPEAFRVDTYRQRDSSYRDANIGFRIVRK